MQVKICKRAFYGYRFADEGRNGENEIYRVVNHSGAGEMFCYDVCEGIQLTYNSLEMDTCFQKILPASGFMLINHCLEGCYEYELQDGTVSFMGEGDLCINDLGGQSFVNSHLPTRKYRGLAIILDLQVAQASLDRLFPQANIDLFRLRDYLCVDGKPLRIRARSEIDHIFSELYCVDEHIRVPYYIIKVIELFLFLSIVEREKLKSLPSFSYSVASSTRAVYTYLIENPLKRVTIGELASLFHIADSSLKRCFKALTGQSIGTFMKRQRIQRAADILLEHHDINVTGIAEIAGYENVSKFSAAFKSVFHQLPLVYRNQNQKGN